VTLAVSPGRRGPVPAQRASWAVLWPAPAGRRSAARSYPRTTETVVAAGSRRHLPQAVPGEEPVRLLPRQRHRRQLPGRAVRQGRLV